MLRSTSIFLWEICSYGRTTVSDSDQFSSGKYSLKQSHLFMGNGICFRAIFLLQIVSEMEKFSYEKLFLIQNNFSYALENSLGKLALNRKQTLILYGK